MSQEVEYKDISQLLSYIGDEVKKSDTFWAETRDSENVYRVQNTGIRLLKAQWNFNYPPPRTHIRWELFTIEPGYDVKLIKKF